MMVATLKLIPAMVSWAVIVTALSRRFSLRRTVAVGSAAGFAVGVAAGALLFSAFRGDLPFSVIKTAVGFSVLALLALSASALYRATAPGADSSWNAASQSIPVSTGCSIFAGLLSGAISTASVVQQGALPHSINLFLLGLSGALVAVVAVHAGRFVPASVAVTSDGLPLLTVSMLLFASSFRLQLDLFSPLSMKVMKFIHDFVHQFFESMLLPDHLFARPRVWDYIGYLFSSGVGFWAGLIIWIAPPIMIMSAVKLERLPSVAHIRQGAKRRKLLAAAIVERRCRLIVPLFALMILSMAVYKSRFPTVEYWDPKPLVVTADHSGKILIPKKGEIDLGDGKLHKYLLKRGGREVRFIVLMTSEAGLTVTLDACAICKPEGYGQADGSVICYYCKTLIPLETVGKPGGCNPVPVSFKDNPDEVLIDASTLLDRWNETVATTAAVKGQGK